MNNLKTYFTLVFVVFSSFAFSSDLNLRDLKSGDVLLLSFNCMECRYIESETGGPYSHSGVVSIHDRNVFVMQALGNVNEVPLSKFLKPKTPESKVRVMRAKNLNENRLLNFQKIFNEKYNGKPFDSEFLWDNLDLKGNEKFYCSEFVAKFLNEFLDNQSILPYPLSYNKHPEYWRRMFKGQLPNGVPGNSPVGIFNDGENFEDLGDLSL